MHRIVSCALVALACAGRIAAGAEPAALQNPAIDSAAYLRVVNAAIAHRATHRLTEDEFIALSALPGTVVLDARSSERYQALHVQGAVNLPFPDITAASLAALIPDPDTRVLIYCNNNFRGAPISLTAKAAPASLNISTYVALATYGYSNVYELGPLLDVKTTKMVFEGG
jgi:phage shock protein E